MRVLVTGADGFVGSWLVPHLANSGHAVVAAIRPGETSQEVLDRRERLDAAARVVELSLESDVSVAALMEEGKKRLLAEGLDPSDGMRSSFQLRGLELLEAMREEQP